MIVWSIFAVGGVYAWAALPLMVAIVPLFVLARPTAAASSDTRTLDRWLFVLLAACVLPLVPLPLALRAALSPGAETVRAAMDLQPDASRWRPLSVSPASTAYALGLVLTGLAVFWTARASCARGMAHRIVRHVAFAGLIAALAAIVFQAAGDRTLIYARWRPLDAGARPFGPFVNRNHFATWVLMACPLAAGYVASTLRVRSPLRGAAAKLVAAAECLGTSALWVGVAAIVMSIALGISTSRSGLVAFAASPFAAVWLARGRLSRDAGVAGAGALLAAAVIFAAYVDTQPLLSRLEETLAVGAGERPRIWFETLRLIRDFPFAGTGLGGYQAAMLVYQQADRSAFFNQAHNQYLQLLAEGGLLVVIPAVLAALAFARLFMARLAQDTSSAAWLRIGAATAMLAVAVQGIWETGLRIPANGLLFAVAAAVAVYRPK